MSCSIRPGFGSLLTSSYRQHQESLAAERESKRLEREERLQRIEREERNRFKLVSYWLDKPQQKIISLRCTVFTLYCWQLSTGVSSLDSAEMYINLSGDWDKMDFIYDIVMFTESWQDNSAETYALLICYNSKITKDCINNVKADYVFLFVVCFISMWLVFKLSSVQAILFIFVSVGIMVIKGKKRDKPEQKGTFFLTCISVCVFVLFYLQYCILNLNNLVINLKTCLSLSQ